MATKFSDINSDIIQTHILPKLDGPSLSTAAAVSSHLQSLCSDHNLWSPTSKSTWPSITHPRVADVISTFPAGHRSFFQDSFPSLITDVNQLINSSTSSCDDLNRSSHPCPSELISAVDIRYQNDVVYSKVEFTSITADFLYSKIKIELYNNKPDGKGSGSESESESEDVTRISRHIDRKVDVLAGADEATLSHLKESMTLNWIIIDPTQKRAGNISSIKPVSARQAWMSNGTVLRYVTVLPGCDPNEMVQCRIKMVLGVDSSSNMGGLYVKKVVLKLRDVDYNCLSGREFLVITQRAISEQNNVIRKVIDDDEERWKSYNEFEELKRNKKEMVEKEEEKRVKAIKMNYVGILVSFCFSLYFLMMILIK
ncbi:F-box protein At2g27310-like [Rutidosis leptorrhynchoides]|uniref:F-box protein At2g27310-like n=1 Tax=Rutidosis leptorrhynchoides TaxID=125765 RepID=UPI003A99F94D